MLVLTRRKDESLLINDNIVVTILGVEGEKVKIGISAPREVQVYRKELFEAINEQNQIAEKLLSVSEDQENFNELRQFIASEISEVSTSP